MIKLDQQPDFPRSYQIWQTLILRMTNYKKLGGHKLSRMTNFKKFRGHESLWKASKTVKPRKFPPLTLFSVGFFGAAHWMGGSKSFPSLKSIAHILQ